MGFFAAEIVAAPAEECDKSPGRQECDCQSVESGKPAPVIVFYQVGIQLQGIFYHCRSGAEQYGII
jgi:hypothetical protein